MVKNENKGQRKMESVYDDPMSLSELKNKNLKIDIRTVYRTQASIIRFIQNISSITISHPSPKTLPAASRSK